MLSCIKFIPLTTGGMRYVTKKVSRCSTIPLTRSLSTIFEDLVNIVYLGCKEAAPRLRFLGASSLLLQLLCGFSKQKSKHQWKAELHVSRMTPETRSRTTGSRALFFCNPCDHIRNRPIAPGAPLEVNGGSMYQ